MRLFNEEFGKAITDISPDTMERLSKYSWPGNIRELQTVLRHAMLHAIGPILVPEFLPVEVRDHEQTTDPNPISRPQQGADLPTKDALPAVSAVGNSTHLTAGGDTAFTEFIEAQFRGPHGLSLRR